MSDIKESIPHKIRLLNKARHDEIVKINKHYYELIQDLHKTCKHKYGEWYTRRGTVAGDTNWQGISCKYRVCKLCLKEERQLDEYQNKQKVNHES